MTITDATPAPTALTDAARPRSTPLLGGLALCLLIAILQVTLGDYQIGVGNQSIQIAFLKHYANPDLYAADAMVVETLPKYPTYFFRLLAPFLSWTSVESLYLGLHILTGFLTLSAVYLLSRVMFRRHWSAMAAVLMLAAGHHVALGGESLYSKGFTHTYAVLPFAVGALALAFRGKWVWAFAVAGLLTNLHALTAVYVLAMLGAGLFTDLSRASIKPWLVRAFLCTAFFFITAAPTLALILSTRQTYDAQWLSLMRIRSADHSFPSSWWTAGDPDVPRFILIFALFVMSWRFLPARPDRPNLHRMTALMTGAVLLLFATGYIFTEIFPLPTMIRLQPFRASRLLLIVMFVQIAHAVVESFRVAGDLRRPIPAREKWPIALQLISAALTLAVLVLPPFLPLLPAAVLIALIAALATGRIASWQAPLPVLALLIAWLAYVQIQFPLRAISPFPLPSETLRTLAATSLACLLLLGIPLALLQSRLHRRILVAFALAVGISLGLILFHRLRAAPSAMPLAGAAAWAKSETDASDIFLTPTGLANFRIAAERSLVGDWRDGTQLYFAADFGPDWLARVSDLEPGLKLSPDGTRLLSRGKPLDTLNDKTLIDLAKYWGARYIVLPTRNEPSRFLTVAYTDKNFTVYEPRLPVIAVVPPAPTPSPTPPPRPNPRPTTIAANPPPRPPASRPAPAPIPAPVPTRPAPTAVPNDVFAPQNWRAAEEFMATIVQQNIEKHRKADLTLVLTDAAGTPLQNIPIKLEQLRHAFTFGISLSFFESNNISPNGDLKPLPVRPVELEKAPEVFNGSMIAFSSKWQYLEPEKSRYHWSDLDKYVDYAVKNNWTLEFHHLSGTIPDWASNMGAVEGQRGLNFSRPIPAVQKEFERYCLDAVSRYADRIKYFQVVNEKYMMEYTPPIFKMLKEKFPNNKFGASDCVKFWDGSGASGNRTTNTDMYKGADAVDWLIQQGVQPDFFSVHGHYPMGLWANPRQMYEIFDYFQKRNCKVHITEEYLQLQGAMVGPLRSGTWDEKMQAEYLTRYLAIAFSHPNVELVNLWGLSPNGWGASNSGLIDAAGKPRPAFDALKKLIHETWHTSHSANTVLDGSLKTRAFHGSYRATITLPGGKSAQVDFTLPEITQATIQLTLDPSGKLITKTNP